MADSKKGRRNPIRPLAPPARTDDVDADDGTEADDAPSRGGGSGGGRPLFGGSNVWPLIAGLAIGFAVGREAYRFGGGGEGKSADAAASPSAAPDKAAAVKAYAKMADFPSGWLKDADLGNAGSALAGLTDAQKTTVMQAMNERNCECGCGMGSLATCLQKDPNCPRSPQMAKLAVDLVKQGKTVAEIEAAIDAKQKEAGGNKPAAAAPEQPTGPRLIELAAWNPRKGPKAAKVTIVEFSDFQ
jgi:hypothetical protein